MSFRKNLRVSSANEMDRVACLEDQEEQNNEFADREVWRCPRSSEERGEECHV
jgi:hypothetical protein